MGTVRLLLAITVVLSHTRLYGTVYGHIGDNELAVKLFFMISGFLMSLVLNRTAAYRDVRTFYLSRALRLYPAYWVMAAATLAWWCLFPEESVWGGGWSFVRSFSAPAQAVLAITNVAIVGQDVVMFLRPTATGVAFTRDFTLFQPPLWHGLLVPPAWSLSLELAFYLIAPFVLRRLWLTVALAIGSMALSLLSYRVGLSAGAFSYRFFPFELALFLVGALSERLWLPHAKRFGGAVRWSPALVVPIFCLYPHVPGPNEAKTLVYLGGFAATLPFLALFNRERRWDEWIGNLSYPLYIGHYLPLEVAERVTAHWPHPHRMQLIVGYTLAAATTLLIFYGVDRPIERRRRRLRGEAAPLDVSTPAPEPGSASPGSRPGDAEPCF